MVEIRFNKLEDSVVRIVQSLEKGEKYWKIKIKSLSGTQKKRDRRTEKYLKKQWPKSPQIQFKRSGHISKKVG